MPSAERLHPSTDIQTQPVVQVATKQACEGHVLNEDDEKIVDFAQPDIHQGGMSLIDWQVVPHFRTLYRIKQLLVHGSFH